jgi:hypothetical protein
MQDLDSFISPNPGIEGDIPIPATSISARDPGIESYQGPATKSGARASRSRASKRKAPIAPSYPKKDKKAPGKPSGGINISDPKPKDPASTPPSGTQKGILILRSKMYTYLQFFILPSSY